MRASKLLLALGLTAGTLALPDDGVPGQVDTGNAAKGPHGHWPLGPPGRRDEATQTKDTTSVTDRAEAKAKHDPAVPPNAKVSPPEEKAVHPAGSGDLPQHPPRDKPYNPLDPGCWDKHQSGPNEPRQVSKENSGMDGMPPIDPPCKGHTSPPPKFKDHHEERSLVIPAMADDDWTHWACSRGVQWACQYPDIDKRDVLFLDYKQACDTARQACDYYADNCACQWAEHCEDKIEWWPFNDVEDEIKACLCRLGYLDYRGNCPNFGADQNVRIYIVPVVLSADLSSSSILPTPSSHPASSALPPPLRSVTTTFPSRSTSKLAILQDWHVTRAKTAVVATAWNTVAKWKRISMTVMFPMMSKSRTTSRRVFAVLDIPVSVQ